MSRLRSRSKTRYHEEEIDVRELILDFQLRWDLDERCTNFMDSMPEDLQLRVAQSFRHRPDQTNPSKRCLAFAQKVLQTHCGAQSSSPDTRIEDFCARWGLDQHLNGVLSKLTADVLETVLDNFTHQPHQTNPSVRCLAFIKSVQGKQSYADTTRRVISDPLLAFQAQWGISDRVVDALANASEEVRRRVITQYEHKPGIDPSARCLAFLNSVSAKAAELAERISPEPPPLKRRRRSPGRACAVSEARASRSKSSDRPPLRRRSKSPDRPPLRRRPPPDRSPLRRLSTRCLDESSNGRRTAWRRSPEPRREAPRRVASPRRRSSSSRRRETARDFQEKWLLEDWCYNFLCTLPDEILAKVVAKFRHSEDQTNPSVRCMAFAKSILKNDSEDIPRGQRSPTRPPGDLSARPAVHSLPAPPAAPPTLPDAPAEVSGDFKSDEEGVQPNERSKALNYFQAKWDVDDECIEYIEKLPAEVQALVIKMYHRGDEEQGDPSEHCQDFARDVLEQQRLCPRPPMPHSTTEPPTYPGHRKEPERRRSPPPPPLPAPPPARPEGSRIRGREQRRDGQADCNRSYRRGDSKSALNNFQAKWGVDDRCMSYLESLPEHVQAKVIERFIHEPHHTNVSVRCMAFTRTVAQRSGGAADDR